MSAEAEPAMEAADTDTDTDSYKNKESEHLHDGIDVRILLF